MDNDRLFPVWGPYSKKYMGISRISEKCRDAGVRFDFTCVPAVFGGDIRVPNATLPSGCHPWRCSRDYSLYTYRFDMIGKTEVYAEVSYARIDDEQTLVRTQIFNNSPLIQNCLVNYFSSVEYPSSSVCKVFLPHKHDLKKALEYDEYFYAVPRPWDSQNADGMKKGEFADERFLYGFGLGDRAGKWHMPHKVFKPFGGEKGDSLIMHIDCENDYDNAVLVIRYRTSDIKYEQGKMVGVNLICSKTDAAFMLNGERIVFKACDEPQLAFFKLSRLSRGRLDIKLVSLGEGAAEFDFFCVCEESDAQLVGAQMKDNDFVPEIEIKKCEDSGYESVCRYHGVEGEYTLRTFSDNTRYREIETGALEDCMTARLSNSDPTFDDVTESFTGAFSRKHSDPGFFHNAVVHTIFINPGESHIEYAVISNGAHSRLSEDGYEAIYLKRLAETQPIKLSEAGRGYELSVNILKATVLTNVVYPIYKHGEYIIHHTPGKRWDCLYTWDSGFIGLGMNDDYSSDFAWEILTTYLSDENNADYAFLHHGSPVPVQMYLWLEMLKKANDKTRLLSLYPKLKHYYDFLAGKIRGSTTAKLKSGLTTTYDYFYSSSGMDDYPAQVAMMDRNIRDTSAPVISSSQVIRCAKILLEAAVKLGKSDDAAVYEDDISRITAALNKYSWDEESGYYGYALHGDDYMPTGEIMRTEDGENLNKGLDGIYPLIAGACDVRQRERILSHLKSEKEMLSKFGISAVDMSASYFMVNGYWNGNVWFPHQWFIWKTMLDLGDADFAYKIARLALDIWKREVDYSYYTFEMVSVVTGRGGWFHNFGGLSTPITMWANAYYKKGTLNTGFDTWVDFCEFNEKCDSLECRFTHFGDSEKATILAVADDSPDILYSVTLDGKEISFNERFKGTLEITLSPCDSSVHTLKIERAN